MTVDGEIYNCSINGAGSWKDLTIVKEKTGEVILEKKFYKSEFGNIMRDPQYQKYVLAVVDAAYSTNIDYVPHDESNDNPESDE